MTPQPTALPLGLAARTRTALTALAPGLGLTLAMALGAMALARGLGVAALTPMAIAMLGGVALRNLTALPARFEPGIAFTLKRVLRAGVVLLGFRLTLGDVAAVGAPGVAVIAVVLGASFVFTKALGRAMGVERGLAELIAAGTSVCGASAVLAVNTVTRAAEEDVAYAIACVTLFGTLSMLGFPLLANALGMDAAQYGLWAGAAIHEVAQVVGAAFSQGEAAGQAGTVAKLTRVMMLAPLILVLGGLARARGGAAEGRAPAPWFVFGFLAAVGANSTGLVPAAAHPPVAEATGLMLTAALAAMGLGTDLRKLRLKGLRPLLLGAAGWLFISSLAAGLVRLV